MTVAVSQPTKGWAAQISRARAAQTRWAALPLAARLSYVRSFRHLVATRAEVLAGAAAEVTSRSVAEKLVSEVLPLADACRWLERRAAEVLSTRSFGVMGRPLWLQGSSFKVQRKPYGTVLVIGPGNYPLFLPAVQTLHALTAGNAVLLKPAPGATGVAVSFAKLIRQAGLDEKLLTILPEEVETARQVLAAGVDKVIFTGSARNGREVLATLARTNTPAVMELSGEDVVLVLADANVDLVIRALKFGARLNGGETCIAPHRVIAVAEIGENLVASMAREGLSALPVEMVADEKAALRRIAAGPYALGVSIFAQNVSRARSLAGSIVSGFVLVNDLIVPTADPRMPFGGRKASGFGVTRGEEGLREMTYPHVVAVRRGESRPHFDEHGLDEGDLFSAYIGLVHGHGRRRLVALRLLLAAVLCRARRRHANR
jgi:acyl-CoA reductase-like NAD-dependent aldehyde dehydrogenase